MKICSLVLLLLPILVYGIEISVENETEFWTDVLAYAESVGVRRSVLLNLLTDTDIEKRVTNDSVDQEHQEHHEHHEKEHKSHGVKVASWKFDYVKEPLVLTLFIIVIGLFKLGYHHSGALQALIPESCALILVGVVCGLVFIGDTTHESIKFLEFNSKTFFFFLLPPIILESAYSLKDRAFIDNIGTIVLYAVVGTVLNIAIIGGFLILFSELGMMGDFRIDSFDCLIFASLIAAVDPVAVLAIFQEVGVNKMLYFMVFGESLLNDAVTVVCYNLMIEFKELPVFKFTDVILGLLAFLCVSLGGLFIGLACGAMSAIITRFTEHVRVVEPVVLFGMAYLSYMVSELFHFSGIIGIIACGLFQSHYACKNIASKSYISVTYFAKVASAVSESLIFIVLGVMLVNEQEWFWSEWHPLFSIYSVVLCTVSRIAVVFFLTYIVNQFTGGVRYISFQEQLIMAYGGLRGAVSFSLAFMINDDVPVKATLLSATYMVILFTVFAQGSTIKLLVRYLNIRLAKKEDRFYMFMEFNRGVIAHMSQGIEEICGYQDTSWVARLSSFSKHYLRPLLEKNYDGSERREGKLLEMDRAATMREAMKASPSTSSFKRQQRYDEMMDNEEIPREMMEEDDNFIPRDRKDLEKETAELTKDIMHIRQLMHNPMNEFYYNRNLIGEDLVEKRHEAVNMQRLHHRAKGLQGKKKRNILGIKTGKAKRSTNQGLILASMSSLGVHAMEADLNGSESGSMEEDHGIKITTELYTITEGEAS
ncbi:unnamed protein product [Auanema sp. JU1783]|nr:unnamed protein product [Auanema sp. JU1783]